MNVDAEVTRILNEVKEKLEFVAWLTKNRDKFLKCPEGRFYDGGIDFDYKPHSEVIQAVRAVGGKWKKEPANIPGQPPSVHYETQVDGRKVRCFAGKPPPSCRLVEIEEDVPEQVIPAHKVKRVKMVCKDNPEPVLSAVAFAQLASPDPIPEAVPASPEPETSPAF